MELRLQAPAKINLYLNVGEKRPDGYHEIDSLFQMIDLYDELQFHERKERIELVLIGPRADRLVGENLVLKAARLLQEASGTRLGAAIRLEKRIPVGSGLGGGSSDAAATLAGLNRLWGIGWPREELLPLAAQLGSDVPFFLGPPTARVGGRGERVEKVSLGQLLKIVLVFPGVSIATAWAYAALDERLGLTKDPRKFSIKRFSNGGQEVLSDLLRQTNDFELVVLPAYPEVARAKDSLQRNGAVLTRMSGSGSTVFGLFREGAAGEKAAIALRPEWGSENVWFCHSLKQSSFENVFCG